MRSKEGEHRKATSRFVVALHELDDEVTVCEKVAELLEEKVRV